MVAGGDVQRDCINWEAATSLIDITNSVQLRSIVDAKEQKNVKIIDIFCVHSNMSGKDNDRHFPNSRKCSSITCLSCT